MFIMFFNHNSYLIILSYSFLLLNIFQAFGLPIDGYHISHVVFEISVLILVP